jgi:hypothetical protein
MEMTLTRQNQEGSQDFGILLLQAPKTMRLTKAPKNTADASAGVDEAIFTVRGIICAKDLPPIFERPT